MSLRVLILGGTTEATALARLLAGDPRFAATLSLAGRTSEPRPQPLPTRIGGFGGIDGLTQYLRTEQIEAMIDTTHPYADRMSTNAVAACAQVGVPLASLVRPPWQVAPGDCWQIVPDTDAAALAIGSTPRRVFLSLGRQELHCFAAAPQHRYLARLIESPQQDRLPPDLTLIQARGPFDLAAETKLLTQGRIEVVVSKNSGGSSTYAKIEAARTLGLPVIMIARPDKPAGHVVRTPEEAVAWLVHASRRGV